MEFSKTRRGGIVVNPFLTSKTEPESEPLSHDLGTIKEADDPSILSESEGEKEESLSFTDIEKDEEQLEQEDSCGTMKFYDKEEEKPPVSFGHEVRFNNVRSFDSVKKPGTQYGTAKNYRESMISIENNGGSCKPLKTWYRTLVIRQSCHSQMAEDFQQKDRRINTISVAITAITSSSIFSSLAPPDPNEKSSSYSFMALFAGVLAAVNTVILAIAKTCNYARKGENHLAAFKDYTRLRFKMENLVGDKQSYYHHDGIDDADLDKWIEKYTALLESEPIIPQDVFEEVEEKEDNAGLKWTKSNVGEE